MNYDQTANLAELGRDEDCKLKLYIDTTGNHTIGWGTNVEAIDQEEADWLRGHRIAKGDAALEAALPWVNHLDPVRQRVMSQMAYNMGLAGLLTFQNTLRAIREGRWGDASDGLLTSLADHQEPARVGRWAAAIKTGIYPST